MSLLITLIVDIWDKYYGRTKNGKKDQTWQMGLEKSLGKLGQKMIVSEILVTRLRPKTRADKWSLVFVKFSRIMSLKNLRGFQHAHDQTIFHCLEWE